jgi:hypothetical protein
MAFEDAFNQTGQKVGVERQSTPESEAQNQRKDAIKTGVNAASYFSSLNQAINIRIAREGNTIDNQPATPEQLQKLGITVGDGGMTISRNDSTATQSVLSNINVQGGSINIGNVSQSMNINASDRSVNIGGNASVRGIINTGDQVNIVNSQRIEIPQATPEVSQSTSVKVRNVPIRRESQPSQEITQGSNSETTTQTPDQLKAEKIKNEILQDSYSDPDAMIQETEKYFMEEMQELSDQFSAALIKASETRVLDNEKLDSLQAQKAKVIADKVKFISQLQALKNKQSEIPSPEAIPTLEKQEISDNDDVRNEGNFPYSEKPPRRVFDMVKGGLKKVNGTLRSIVNYPNREFDGRKVVINGQRYWNDRTIDKVMNKFRSYKAKLQGKEVYREGDEVYAEDESAQVEQYDQDLDLEQMPDVQPNIANPETSNNNQGPEVQANTAQTLAEGESQNIDSETTEQTTIPENTIDRVEDYQQEYSEKEHNLSDVAKLYSKEFKNNSDLKSKLESIEDTHKAELDALNEKLIEDGVDFGENTKQMEALEAKQAKEIDDLKTKIEFSDKKLEVIAKSIEASIQKATDNLEEYYQNRKNEILQADSLEQLQVFKDRYDSGIYEPPDYIDGLLENMPESGLTEGMATKFKTFNEQANNSLNEQLAIQSALKQKIDLANTPFTIDSLANVAKANGEILRRGNYILKVVDGKLIGQFQRTGEEPKLMPLEDGGLEIDSKGRLLFKEDYQFSPDSRPVFWIQDIQKVYNQLVSEKIEATLNPTQNQSPQPDL